MGLFSRKPKTPRPLTKDSASFDSDNSHNHISISRSSNNKSVRSNKLNFHSNSRTSASSLGGLQSPLTPMTPHIPKVNLPKPPDPSLDAVGYLRSLGAVRERCKVVTEKALSNQLNHFDVDLDKFPDVVQFVCRIIKVCCLFLLPVSLLSYCLIALYTTSDEVVIMLLILHDGVSAQPSLFLSSSLCLPYLTQPSLPIYTSPTLYIDLPRRFIATAAAHEKVHAYIHPDIHPGTHPIHLSSFTSIRLFIRLSSHPSSHLLPSLNVTPSKINPSPYPLNPTQRSILLALISLFPSTQNT